MVEEVEEEEVEIATNEPIVEETVEECGEFAHASMA